MNVFWTCDLAWWKLLAAALALGGVLALSWRHVRRERAQLRRGALAVEILRVLGVAALLVTLLQFERIRILPRTLQPEVLVLCDVSASMTTRDVVTAGDTGAVSRAGWLAAQRARKFWAPLEPRYNVRVEEICAPPTNDAPDAGTDLNAALDRAVPARGSRPRTTSGSAFSTSPRGWPSSSWEWASRC